MARNTARLTVGRLLEIRAAAGYRSADDVDAIFDEIDRQLERLPEEHQHVTVVDWRRCPLMAPEAAERIAVRIANMNDRTERSGALASSESPVALLQFLRLIREAGLPSRRLFFDALEMRQWVEEVLTPQEASRLADFLEEAD